MDRSGRACSRTACPDQTFPILQAESASPAVIVRDVIVMGNGRNVIVRPIEEHLKTSPAIEECVLACPAQTHLVAVVSPAAEPADEAEIVAQLARTNATLGPDRQIRRAIVAAPRFSVENGLLTSQFKPKRRQIVDAYQKELDDDREGIHAR